MKKSALIAVLIGVFFAFSSFAGIVPGDPITVYDNWSNSANWHGTSEDQEVEPPDVHGQQWDLEGFFLDGSNLSMVGGYNFATGQYGSGDIFIDVDGDAKYGKPDIGQVSGDGHKIINNTGGWDYAISLNFNTGEYEVYQIDENSMIKTPYYGVNRPSSPFEYASGGTLLSSAGGSFTYMTGLSDAQTGFKDGMDDKYFTHNMVTGIDLSFLGNTDFTTHFTMGCGNDMLIGKGTINVPEPGTLSLIGIGLLSLAGLLRFRRRK